MSYRYVTLVRHGRPEGVDQLLGRTDPELTPLGWQQMQQVCAGVEADVVFTSPLRRCRAFAEYWANDRSLPVVEDAAFRELDFGEWDGETLGDLWLRPEFARYWEAPFAFSPPGGESTKALLQRVSSALDELATGAHQRVLIVTHSGVMRAVLAWLLNSQYEGNPHLSRVHLSHAARLDLSLYRDEDGRIWPQLLGLQQHDKVED